ncbi:MAG: hypothetical protein ACT4SY_10735 [Hyphomicrobiales bacterium]
MAVLAVSAYAIANDAPWIAALLGGGMLATIVFGFLRVFGDGPRSRPPEKDEGKDSGRAG